MKRTIEQLLAQRGFDPRRIVFCPSEGLSAQDLRRIVKLAADLTPGIEPGDRYWLFDEITYVNGWATALKQLRDQTLLRGGCVVATGSSGANLRDAQGELAGREGRAGELAYCSRWGFAPLRASCIHASRPTCPQKQSSWAISSRRSYAAIFRSSLSTLTRSHSRGSAT